MQCRAKWRNGFWLWGVTIFLPFLRFILPEVGAVCRKWLVQETLPEFDTAQIAFCVDDAGVTHFRHHHQLVSSFLVIVQKYWHESIAYFVRRRARDSTSFITSSPILMHIKYFTLVIYELKTAAPIKCGQFGCLTNRCMPSKVHVCRKPKPDYRIENWDTSPRNHYEEAYGFTDLPMMHHGDR